MAAACCLRTRPTLSNLHYINNNGSRAFFGSRFTRFNSLGDYRFTWSVCKYLHCIETEQLSTSTLLQGDLVDHSSFRHGNNYKNNEDRDRPTTVVVTNIINNDYDLNYAKNEAGTDFTFLLKEQSNNFSSNQRFHSKLSVGNHFRSPLSSSLSSNSPLKSACRSSVSGFRNVYGNEMSKSSCLTLCLGGKFTGIKTIPRLLDSYQMSVIAYRTYATKRRSATHYYDILGLAPKASQKQIKSAYYKMSKVYHPDVARDKHSHFKFTEISEAYEILGNIQKRRLYDRGLMHERDPRAPYNPDDMDLGAAQARRSPFERGERPPPPRGRTRIYNFDEFYRQHYNEMRERKSREWNEHIRQQNIKGRHYHAGPGHAVSGPLLFSLWVLFGFILIVLSEGHSPIMPKDLSQRREIRLMNDSQEKASMNVKD